MKSMSIDVLHVYLFECISLIRSFAFETVKDRLPIIVTRIVDFLARHRARIANELGEVSVSVRE